MSDWLAAGVVWGLVLFSFYRGYHKEQKRDRFMVLTWSIFMSVACVFTLRIPAVEIGIDSWLGDHPIVYFFNAGFTLTAAVLYAISLGMFRGDSKPEILLRPIHRRVIYAALGVAVLLCLLLVGSLSTYFSPADTRHLMRFVLSAYLLVLMFGMLIPFNWWMYSHEQVFPMRCKHLALIAGLGIYTFGAMIAVVMIPLHLLTEQVQPDYAANMRGVLGGLCLLVILIPHRWIVMLLLPQKLRLYRRIARLDQWIAARMKGAREGLDWQRAFSPLYVDHVTYLAVINIMDHYREIRVDDVSGQAVVEQIQTLWPDNPRYDDLVQALSQVAI